jgi:CRP/FNR family transcriptional regulator, cyclic AMP receptor protein
MDLDLLRRIPLLSRLDDSELTRVSSLLQHRQYKANQPVIWIGETGDELFLIAKGSAVVYYPDEKGKEVVLASLTSGDFFGDVALLDGGKRTASIRTTSDSEMLVLQRDEFFAFLRQNPEAALDVLTTVGHRYREILEKLRGVQNANVVIDQQTTRWERIADTIAAVSASQPFVLFHVVWFGTWVIANIVMGERGWDPFPFGLLTLIVSLEAIFLSIFVLVSANRSGEKDRIRADADYQVNLKAQYEIMQLHAKLDRLLERSSRDA